MPQSPQRPTQPRRPARTVPKRTAPKRTVREHGPDPVDVHVGRRVRLRRTLLGMTQDQLAEAIGVAFQQVQKYERGANRVSASRLYDIARALGVGIAFFFEDLAEEDTAARPTARLPGAAEALAAAGPRHERDDLSRTRTLQLLRAYWALPDDTLRSRVLDLLESMRKGG